VLICLKRIHGPQWLIELGRGNIRLKYGGLSQNLLTADLSEDNTVQNSYEKVDQAPGNGLVQALAMG